MFLTIIQRYVIGEVLRSFILALVAMTGIFVLFMVMAEALKFGLTPGDIIRFVPFVVPSTLPFTIPVSLLFAVTVVYGRLASDNEIVAIKTAGKSATIVLIPTWILGAVMSGVLVYLSAIWIPRAAHEAKLVIFKNSEEMFYKFLRKDHELKNPRWPFLIFARTVEGKTMIDPTFKHRESLDNMDRFDTIIQAKKATIRFDYEHSVAHVYFVDAEISNNGKNQNIVLINNNTLDMPLPPGGDGMLLEKKTQEWTNTELVAEQKKVKVLIDQERKRQAISVAFGFGSGRVTGINWKEFQTAYIDYGEWQRRYDGYETEKQFRNSLAFGSFFFVLLGAPVGIRFARRDFLSAFITCFLPIIGIYYPLLLLGINLGKEGAYHPILTLWSGNFVMAVLTGIVLPPVIKH